MAKILVVEDDKKLSAAVCDCLLLEKHTVEAPYSVANQFWHSRKITWQIDGLLKRYQRAQQIEMDNQAASGNIVITTLSLGIILNSQRSLF